MLNGYYQYIIFEQKNCAYISDMSMVQGDSNTIIINDHFSN